MNDSEAAAALAAWVERLDTLDPTRIKLGLARPRAVLARMELSPPPFRVATIGGTNGKGSTVAYLAAFLRRAGLGPVGAYTSPHLLDYRERIVIDGRMIAAADLVAAFEAVEQARGETPLTYFEFGTLAALEAFRRTAVRWAVLEVGLGGRLDAVNALDAEAAAVVSIGLDHQQWLGSDRDSIGREKAGIFRADRAAIVGDRDPPAGLLEVAAERGADVWLIGRDFDATKEGSGWRYRGRSLERSPLPLPAMPGRLQCDDAAVALALFEAVAAERLPGPADLAAVLGSTQLPARIEVRHGEIEWVLDVAHNPQAAAALGEWLARAEPRKTVAVFGMLADKDAAAVAAALAPRIERWFLAPLGGRRGQSATALADKTAAAIRDPVLCENMVQAVAAAAQAARGGERIVVFGSFHALEEALASGLIPENSEPADGSSRYA
ncbi:MAG: bifunctional folylpolyglutamate synthase/dihydrofolate synthase [Gammaproteobacteria bacterium]